MNKSKWKCETCKRSKMGSPIVINKGDEELGTMSSIINIDMESVMNLINIRFNSLKESIDSLKLEVNDKLTQLTDTVSSFDQRISLIEARIDSVSDASTKLAAENESLGKTIENLKMELNARDQDLLINDLEITGIPETKEESVNHLVLLVATKLGVQIGEQDIVNASRVGPVRPSGLIEDPGTQAGGHNTTAGTVAATPAPPRPRPIVIRLARRTLKDQFLKAARVRRGTTTADFELPEPKRNFYVNERLTKTNRLLFNKAREEGKRHGWRFIWTVEGRILARREKGKACHRIKTEADLNSVFGSDKVSSEALAP